LLQNANSIIFATSILHSYLRVQGVGPRAMAISAMIKAISQKYQNNKVTPTEVLFK
jgi:hypothetical protein